MTLNDFINHAETNMDLAGIQDPKRSDVLSLIAVLAFQDHQRTPLHETVDTFARLGKFENLASAAVRESITTDAGIAALKGSVSGWKRYFLDHFKKEEFCDLPPEMLSQSSMWRCGTYESLVDEAINKCGTIAATVLSMAYRPKVIVEMGIDGGATTLQFCRLNPSARVYGVDKFSRKRGTMLPIATLALMQNVNNLTIHIGNSWEFDMTGKVDLCFIDGEHCGDAPMKDSIRAWENRNASGDWCIAWDDYHPNNPDVKSAVDDFVKERKLTLNTVGSWAWVGTKSEKEISTYITS